MSSERAQWQDRVWHMLDAIARIQAYTDGLSIEALAKDDKTVAAICWQFAVIGEAARQIPPAVEQRYPQVPWSQMRGLRNAIVHGYDVVNLDILWDTVTIDLPPLALALKQVLDEGSGA